MDKKELIKSGLIEEYVLGLSSAEEKELIEDLASRDEEVAKLIHDMQKAMDSFCVKRRSGNDSKKAILTSMVKRSVEERPSARLKSLPGLKRSVRWKKIGLAALASAIFCLAVAGTLWWSNKDLRHQLYNLSHDMDDRQQEMQRLAAEDRMLKDRMKFLEDDQTIPIRLTGTSLLPHACATIYWNPQYQESYLKISHLPAPPEGTTYQLWANTGESITNLGSLSPSDTTWKKLPFMSLVKRVHVTREQLDTPGQPNSARVVMAGQF